MRVLITGGCGFVGKHLTREIPGRITVVDVNPCEIENARVVEADILDMPELERHDAIIHLAAKISVQESMRDREGFWRVNVEGTRKMVELARKWDAYFMFFSSAAVYGEYERPVKEEDELRPISPYGMTKMEAERIVMQYPNSLIFRPGNIYGKGKRHKGVIEIFVENAKAGRNLVVRGGKQRRDFIHVEDVAKAVRIFLEKRIKGIYNLGTGVGTSIDEIASLISEMTGVGIIHEEMPEGEIMNSVLDASKLREHFSPSIGIEEGIRRLLE